MQEYELSVLYHPDEDFTRSEDKVLSLLRDVGANILEKQDDGVKRLAYSICGQDYAHYAFYRVMLPVGDAPRFSSQMNITDEVLRYLLVRVDETRQTRATTPQRKMSKNNLIGSF